MCFLGARSLECAPNNLERTPASAPQIKKEGAPPCSPEKWIAILLRCCDFC